jgi:hypothetical protein
MSWLPRLHVFQRCAHSLRFSVRPDTRLELLMCYATAINRRQSVGKVRYKLRKLHYDAQPLIHLPFCPDNTILVEFSGSFAQGLLSAISGRHDGDLIGLMRREVNNQNSAMKSARCSVSTTTSIHTERSYVDWIGRFVRFLGMRSREDLFPAEPKIEAFLADLAMNGNVAPATQNQAMNALVFLYKRVLNHALRGSINAVRADK